MENLIVVPDLALAFSFVESAAGVAALLFLTIAGPALHVCRPHHQHGIEEKIKDNDISIEEGQRRMRMFRLTANGVTLLGATALAIAFIDLMNRI